MQYIPEKGDIIWLDFDPSSGREIIKHRPAFVISRKVFNKHVGMAVVAPITSTIRGIRLEVVLPDELKTQGSILVYQMKSLDIFQRNAKLIETASKEVVDEVNQIASLIVQ